MELLLVAAVLPVIALCYYIYKKDKNGEPSDMLRKLFIFGFLSAIPVLICEIVLGIFFDIESSKTFIGIFINTFISVALVEEGFKWLVTKSFGYDHEEFDEIYDVIVYAVFASLGFACIENILYVFQNGIGNAFMRALTSIPGHTCFGVIMGYFFSRAKVNYLNDNQSMYTKNLIYSILVPTLFHTIYDALIFYAVAIDSLVFILFFFVYDIAMVILCFNIVKKISTMQQNLTTNVKSGVITSTSSGQIQYQPKDTTPVMNFCPICGRDIKGCHYCPSCGFKIQ